MVSGADVSINFAGSGLAFELMHGRAIGRGHHSVARAGLPKTVLRETLRTTLHGRIPSDLDDLQRRSVATGTRAMADYELP